MSLRTIMVGVFAVVFGLAAAIGAFLVSRGPVAPPAEETSQVVVVTENVNRGHNLTALVLKKRQWPKDALPEGAISDLADALDRTVLHPLMAGELLLENNLAPKGAGRGMAAIIPSGMRAVTIQTPNIATGVAGFILPGNRVDVVLTAGGQGSNDLPGGARTFTLLQNIEILAVDQRIDVPQDNKMDVKELRSITLLVTPSDANKLELGQNKGTLHLTLRNPADSSLEEVEQATLRGLQYRGDDSGSDQTAETLANDQHVVKPVEPETPPPAEAAATETKATEEHRTRMVKIRTIRGSQSQEINLIVPRVTTPEVVAGPGSLLPQIKQPAGPRP